TATRSFRLRFHRRQRGYAVLSGRPANGRIVHETPQRARRPNHLRTRLDPALYRLNLHGGRGRRSVRAGRPRKPLAAPFPGERSVPLGVPSRDGRATRRESLGPPSRITTFKPAGTSAARACAAWISTTGSISVPGHGRRCRAFSVDLERGHRSQGVSPSD